MGKAGLMVSAEDRAWIHEACLVWRGEDPAALLEVLMSDERCAAFGPVHHFLVGASLMTCAWPMARHDGAGLSEALTELDSRAACVPGATCAKWGVCGAAASCGMAFAVLAGNAPVRSEGWSEGQLMVSDVLAAIARAGSPRCCKRDSRIAVRTAVPWFNDYFGTGLRVEEAGPVCAVADRNKVCLGCGCLYYPQV